MGRYGACFGVGSIDASAYAAQGLAELTPIRCAEESVELVREALFDERTVGLRPLREAGATAGAAVTRGWAKELWAEAAARLTAEGGGLFVAYFCGHGLQRLEPSATDRTAEALCLRDGLFEDVDLREALLAFPSTARVVFLVDACHAAGLDASDRPGGATPSAAALLLAGASEVGGTRCEAVGSVFANALTAELRARRTQSYAALAEGLDRAVRRRNESVELRPLSPSGRALVDTTAFL